MIDAVRADIIDPAVAESRFVSGCTCGCCVLLFVSIFVGLNANQLFGGQSID